MDDTQGKYTIIILNWQRPGNIGTILDKYVKHRQVDEIIVSQGHKDFPVKFQHNKVHIINDVDLNSQYGLNLRFLNGLSAKNRRIIYTDDDVIVSDNDFNRAISAYEENSKRIVGIMGRSIDAYDDRPRPPWKAGNSIILTKFLIVNKEILRLYFVLFPFFHDLFREGVPFGNGEDILISLIAREFYKNENLSLGGGFENLDTHGIGCQTWDGHAGFRSKLCRCWKNNENLLKSIISNYRRGLV